jgi:hypothetical protein
LLNRIDRRLLTDLGFLAALIALPALPLIVWRDAPSYLTGWPLLAAGAGWFGLLIAWLTLVPAVPAFASSTANDASTAVSPGWFRHSAVAVLLFALTLVVFFGPVRINFWGGVDEFANFEPEYSTIWSPHWDRALGRPLVGVPTFVAVHLLPDRIEGFLWVGTFLCFANGWLLYLLLGQLAPRSAIVPGVAAVLLVINRADPLRFFVMWASNHYQTVVLFLLLATWLFVLSYTSRNRALLVLSCLSLSGALLSNESSYPTAALIPLIGLAVRKDWKSYLAWTFAWYGTIALLTARFVVYIFMQQATSYQGGHLKGVLKEPSSLFWNLQIHLAPILDYFELLALWKVYVAYAWLTLVFAVLVVVAARRWRTREPLHLAGIGVSAVAILFGVLPFLPMASTPRTQFIVAPAEATFLALLLGLLVRVLPARIGVATAALLTGVVAASSTVYAYRVQQENPSSIRFERTVHLFQQVHAIAPSFEPNTLVLFVLEEPDRTPAGFNYMICPLSRDILGVESSQANFRDPVHIVPRFKSNRVIATLLPEPDAGVGYAPLARMRPGQISPLRFLRYPVWSTPSDDVMPTEDGLMMGDGWGPLLSAGDRGYRVALDGAEWIINPRDTNQRELTLEMEPINGSSSDGTTVELCDDAGEVITKAPFVGHSVVHWTVPLDPRRLSLLHMHVRSPHGSSSRESSPTGVRVYRPENGTRHEPPHADVFRDGVVLGSGWEAVEGPARELFRWAGPDAELDIRFLQATSSELTLTVESGPGCENGPCVLEFRDAKNHLLASRQFRARDDISIPVPASVGGRLKLHVVGGGKHVANDPRVLDYRVFACGAVTH